MSRGTSDATTHTSDLVDIENPKKDGVVAEKSKVFVNKNDFVGDERVPQTMGQVVKILKERFAEKGFAEKFAKQMEEKTAAHRRKREAHRRELLEEARKKRLRSEMKKKMTDTWIALKAVSVLEQFVELCQDALDNLRKALATYYDVAATNHHEPPPPLQLPPPVALRATLPPPLTIDITPVDCHYDVAEKRIEELFSFHQQQLTEANQIKDYETRAMDNYPTWYDDKIAGPVLWFNYEFLCAVEFYTERFGPTLYEDGGHEEIMRLLHEMRQIGLN